MSRISSSFQRLRSQGRVGLVAYLTAGYPDPEATLRLVPAVAEGGADVVELGIPFSDPLADGATIQRANFQALQQGVTTAHCLRMVRCWRGAGLAIPILLMGYYNPILAYGVERFCQDAAAAGVDGLIVVDLPPEEAAALADRCRGGGLDLISMLAPTSSDERIARVAATAAGFIYCVSVTGVTGARDELPAELPGFLARVRQHTHLPLAVGFGISQRRHVEAVGRLAEAAVVGSAIINVIEATPEEQRVERVKAFVEVLAGRGGG